MHVDIKNINIPSTFKCMEMSNKRNKFIHSFIKNNATCTLINDIIFNINNYLNNLIQEFFGQIKFLKY